jgi:hypothetical protein
MVSLWDGQQDEKDKIATKERENEKLRRCVQRYIQRIWKSYWVQKKTMDMFGRLSRNGKTFWENLTGKDGEIDLKNPNCWTNYKRCSRQDSRIFR